LVVVRLAPRPLFSRIGRGVKTIGELIGWGVAAAVLWLAWLSFECIFWPFAPCRRCEGNGKFRSPFSNGFRRCRKCKGRGERVRLGRRLWTKLGIAKKNMVG
jgi:hypothetical protein